ncbi:plasmid mobilization protein [Actinobacillus equuli]|uniref:plasmid mobilization protein n=1 Tax=Actinobacillus equuli TaxID=718 RepID=UPI001013D154|nr:toxin-antitoxin system HicB family antitoxin [Actinobacillus equuli]WGE45037.1 toxin-antitoxin system HicB family antitoxin [Actinobacillus equuli subsp. equuli]
MKNKHGMTGKQNALKEVKADAQIQIRVTSDFKRKLQEKANDQGISLSALIIKALEQI